MPSIRNQPPSIPEPVLRTAAALARAGYPAYLVGGSVRDALLGREPRDWDLATSAPGEAVARLFRRVNPVGLRHNTVGVFAEPLWIEVTTFRDPGVTLEGDLGLRDFTINAMALEPATGRLIDPLGGRADLAAGRLRACLDAAARFAEDPLRALRAARFVAELGLAPDPSLAAACKATLGAFEAVAPERVRDEWVKLLVGAHVREAFDWLAGTGLLAKIFPAAEAARGVVQNRYHRWDVFVHTVETVARAVPEPEVRLAGFFHDLGKPRVRARRKGDYTFYNHERVSAEIAALDLERFRFAHHQAQRIVALVQNHMFHYDPAWSDAAVRRFVRRVSPELLDAQFKLRLADSSAAGLGGEDETRQNLALLQARIARELKAHAALRITDLAVDGNDVIGLLGKSGPLVGAVLRELLERVTDDPALNTRDRLLAEGERIARKLTNAP